MKRFIFSLLLVVSFSVSAQSSEPIVTKEENTSWLNEFEQQELPEKLKMMRQRWEADTAVQFYGTASPHANAPDYKGKTRYRPLYLIRGGDNEQRIFPPNPSSEEIAEVSKMLVAENISDIQVLLATGDQVIYGARGLSGVIIIKISEKAIFEKIASELN